MKKYLLNFCGVLMRKQIKPTISLIIFLLSLSEGFSGILEELDNKKNISRLEYSLDKLMPILTKVVREQNKFLRNKVHPRSLEETCSYAAIPAENRLVISCSVQTLENSTKVFPSIKTQAELETRIGLTADLIAEKILHEFGNMGDPSRENIYKNNILHLETGRMFVKQLYFYDEERLEEKIRVGKKLVELIEIFVGIDLGELEYRYRYLLKDGFNRKAEDNKWFPNKKLWYKQIDGKLIIWQGEQE